MKNEIPDSIEIGKKQTSPETKGYRIVANDTSSGRPWMWGGDDLEFCKSLAATLARELNQEVQIMQYIGCVRPAPIPTEYIEAK